jgi:hypothetical protein
LVFRRLNLKITFVGFSFSDISLGGSIDYISDSETFDGFILNKGGTLATCLPQWEQTTALTWPLPFLDLPLFLLFDGIKILNLYSFINQNPNPISED